jgi:hypothetical protein
MTIDDLHTAYFWHGDALRSRSVSTRVHWGQLTVPALPPRPLADCERELALKLALAPGDVEAVFLPRARSRWPQYRQCVQTAADWLGALGLPQLLPSSEVALMACCGIRYHHDGDHYGGKALCNLFLSEARGITLHFAVTGHRIPLTASRLQEEQGWIRGARARVYPDSGKWLPEMSSLSQHRQRTPEQPAAKQHKQRADRPIQHTAEPRVGDANFLPLKQPPQ